MKLNKRRKRLTDGLPERVAVEECLGRLLRLQHARPERHRGAASVPRKRDLRHGIQWARHPTGTGDRPRRHGADDRRPVRHH